MGNQMTDATNGAEVEIQQSHNQIRGNAIAEIAKRAAAETADDMSDFDEESGEVVQKQKTEEVITDHVDAEKPKQEEIKEPVEDVETIVVDGKQQQVSRDKILEAGRRTLQKESAADKRLQEATEILRRAEQHAQRFTNAPSSDEQSTSLPGEGVMTEKETHGQQFNVQDIERTIEQKVRDSLYMRDADKAAAQFRTEFPEIAGNPIFMSWAAQQEDIRIREAMAAGSDLGDPLEAYRKHGQAARDQLKSFIPPASNGDKADKKRDTVAISGANVRTAAPQPEKPKTTAQIISDMRKNRHQRIN